MPSGRGLAIKKGDIWAFREKERFPLVAVQIVNQPARYEHPITIRLVDAPERGLISVLRAKLPCRWDDVEAYLKTHRDVPRSFPITEPRPTPDSIHDGLADAAKDLFSMGEQTLRRIIREELVRVVGTPKLALNYQEAAAATGYSASVLRIAVRRGDLTPVYANAKPVFLVSELQEWLKALPVDKPGPL